MHEGDSQEQIRKVTLSENKSGVAYNGVRSTTTETGRREWITP
jgi:hypothetical protein